MCNDHEVTNHVDKGKIAKNASKFCHHTGTVERTTITKIFDYLLLELLEVMSVVIIAQSAMT